MIHANTIHRASRRRAAARFVARAFCVFVLIGGALLAGCRKKTPDEKLAAIDQLFQQGNVIGAVLKCKTLIEEAKDDPAAYEARLRLAGYYMQTGDPERALDYLMDTYKGLGLGDPRGQGAFMGILQLYRRQDKAEEALKIVDDALKTVGNDKDTSANLAMVRADCLLRLNRLEDGDRAYRSLALSDDAGELRHEAREQLARYYRDKQEWAKSIGVYEDFLRKEPDSPLRPELEVVMAVAMTKIPDREEEGRKLLDSSLAALRHRAEEELDKEKAAALWMTVGQYCLVAEQTEPAIETFQKVVKDFAGTQPVLEAQFTLSAVLTNLKRYDEAVKALEDVARDNPLSNPAKEAERRIKVIEELRAKGSAGDDATTGTAAQSEPAPPQATPAPQ